MARHIGIWLFCTALLIGHGRGFSSSSMLDIAKTATASQKLEDILDRQGAIRFCEVGKTTYGRGLVATRDLKPGDLALRIPLSCALIEPDYCDDDDKDDEDGWAGRLAKLLVQQDQSETHAAYTQALPPPPATPARGDWPEAILQEFDSASFRRDIDKAYAWRYRQWERYSGSFADRQSFLDALDLVCSRTIRCGENMHLVPLLDMANHASEQEGGGFYKKMKSVGDEEDCICLYVGYRGVREGQEVTLDYGTRSNEDWLIHYGFQPDRNMAETVQLHSTHKMKAASWDDVRTSDIDLQQLCARQLQSYSTTLQEDVDRIRQCGSTIGEDVDSDVDYRLIMAMNYRVSQKRLLAAIAAKGGRENMSLARKSRMFTSAFVDPAFASDKDTGTNYINT
eukprot:CAMPEP_0172459520 /NCGR_PEP_ID=MMETSP1065-20121228/32986_1 /TAXON_ID=265537 /ORGANISM="Amphiprora paludosa, Strain CCMP125" /LENGTH=395 /DNA_ID=CAMNT_0013214231 /DNA_START=45 /DNA_END=1232 /DNA_ORIENTATION=+